MFRNGFQLPHLLLLVIVLVVLFGYKKLPDMTRSVGRSMRIFKSEMSEMKNDGKDERGRTEAREDRRDERHDDRDVTVEHRETTRTVTREADDTERAGSERS